MALPYTLTTDFTEAVDNLTQDATLTDTTLHSRAQGYLEVFNDASTGAQVNLGPAWAERIHEASPLYHPFSTPSLFNAMYEVADELGLVAGRRYVSAAICVCGEHAARADGAADLESKPQAALVRALHQLSSTWMAFLFWPFYAHGHDYRFGEREDDLPEAAGDETPTTESMARAQRRRCKKLVMTRDNCRCFVTGGLDSSAYSRSRPLPTGVTRVVYCGPVSIIPAKICLRSDTSDNRDSQWDQHLPPEQDVTFGILKRFCSVDAATFAEQAQGPANTLFMNGTAGTAFGSLVWCLHPTQTPDRYELKNYEPFYNIGVGLPPVSRHVTFVDHSASGVDLPSRELLRAHAALTGVLNRSGVMDAFEVLHYDIPSCYRGAGRSVCPASTASAFWGSVVEYEGPEACREVVLWEAVEALRQGPP
ncbi:hypothetical protein V8D89_006669 [Ganoderma adspersum]